MGGKVENCGKLIFFLFFAGGDPLHPLLATLIFFAGGDPLHPLLGHNFHLFCRGRPPAPPFLLYFWYFSAGGDPLHPPFRLELIISNLT